MPRKIAFIGAGSFGFTRSLVRDLLSFPALADADHLADGRGSRAPGRDYRACKRIAEEGHYPATHHRHHRPHGSAQRRGQAW